MSSLRRKINYDDHHNDNDDKRFYNDEGVDDDHVIDIDEEDEVEDEDDEEDEDVDSDSISLKEDASLNCLDIITPSIRTVMPDIDNETMNSFDEEDFLSASYAKKCDILIADDDDVLACTDILNCAEKRNTYASIAKKYELELRQHTSSRKRCRRRISVEKSNGSKTFNNYQQQHFYYQRSQQEQFPQNYLHDHDSRLKTENEQRFSTHFYNILERAQQEIVRLKSKLNNLN